MTGPFRILAVCTGNVCRSPAVERLLSAKLVGDDVVVTSAGTGALVGAPISPPMAALIREAGADPAHFAARQVTPQLLEDADLVLALTRRHRAAVVELAPSAVRRAFTVRELAALLEHVDTTALPTGGAGVRLRELVARARAARRALPDDTLDVIDPWQGDAARYARSFAELRPAVARILDRAHP